MTNCISVRDMLDTYGDGDRTTVQQALIDRHLARCYACREYSDDLAVLVDASRRALRHPRPVNRFEQLRSRFELPEESPCAEDLRRQSTRQLIVRRSALAAVAALVLVCVSPFITGYKTLVGPCGGSPLLGRDFVRQKEAIELWTAMLPEEGQAIGPGEHRNAHV